MNGKTFQGRVLRVNMATGATRGAGRGPHMLPQTAVAGGGVVVGGGDAGGAFAAPPQFAGAPQALPLPAAGPAAPAGGGGGGRQPEMAPEQLWQALQDIRAQAAQNPERVAGLLMANQQLALAVAGALAVFGVLASNTPQLIIDARQAQAQAFQQQQQRPQRGSLCRLLPLHRPRRRCSRCLPGCLLGSVAQSQRVKPARAPWRPVQACLPARPLAVCSQTR